MIKFLSLLLLGLGLNSAKFQNLGLQKLYSLVSPTYNQENATDYLLVHPWSLISLPPAQIPSSPSPASINSETEQTSSSSIILFPFIVAVSLGCGTIVFILYRGHQLLQANQALSQELDRLKKTLDVDLNRTIRERIQALVTSDNITSLYQESICFLEEKLERFQQATERKIQELELSLPECQKEQDAHNTSIKHITEKVDRAFQEASKHFHTLEQNYKELQDRQSVFEQLIQSNQASSALLSEIESESSLRKEFQLQLNDLRNQFNELSARLKVEDSWKSSLKEFEDNWIELNQAIQVVQNSINELKRDRVDREFGDLVETYETSFDKLMEYQTVRIRLDNLEIKGILEIEFYDRGNYWLFPTQMDNYWLVPKRDWKINTHLQDDIKKLFVCRDLRDGYNSFELKRPVSLFPEDKLQKKWRLQEKGVLVFFKD